MYCSQCGHEVDDDARFCSSCGDPVGGKPAAAPAASPEPENGEPLLVVRPVFVGSVTALSMIPFQIFLTIWGGLFFGIPGGMAVKALNLPVPFWAPAAAMACLFFFGMPILAYTAKKRTYAKTQYAFYRDRLEYAEGFWTAVDKSIRYDRITEATKRVGVIQRQFGLGTILLSTPATGTQDGGVSRSGIRIRDIEHVDEVYDQVKRLIMQ